MAGEGTLANWKGALYSQYQNQCITAETPGRMELGIWMLYNGFEVDNQK